MDHWSEIGDTSQPYYPNRHDILSDREPRLGILELPDNGILVDYVTIQEMIDIFHANWPGGALSEPVAYSIGFHASQDFASSEYFRMDDTLSHIDRFLAAHDGGPVEYGLQSEMVFVWKRSD
jgi:hypothetical protein